MATKVTRCPKGADVLAQASMIARNANPACNEVAAVTPIADSSALEDDMLVWDVSVADCPRLGVWCSATGDVEDLPPDLLWPSFAAHFPDSFASNPDPNVAALAGCEVVLDSLTPSGSPMSGNKPPKQNWKLVKPSAAGIVKALASSKEACDALAAALVSK